MNERHDRDAGQAFSDDGDPAKLFGHFQHELRRLAAHCMRDQPNGHTLQPTALVNEVFVKIVGGRQPGWNDQQHFLLVAARAMRSILVDHARSKNRQKRKAPGERVPLDSLLAAYEERGQDILALNEILEKLRAFDPVMADAVDLHFIAGRTLAETAQVLDIPMRTFERHWATTKAWLLHELEDAEP